MDKKEILRWLIIPFALFLVILLLTQISLSDIAVALSSVSIPYLLLGFILYAAVYAARALRFRTMLNHQGNFTDMFNIVSLHSLANNVMPFRTGEFSFVYLTKARLKVPAALSLSTVALARIYDALAVCILSVFMLAMTYGSFTFLAELMPIVIVIMVIAIVIIVSLIWCGEIYLRAFNYLVNIKMLNIPVIGTISSKLEEMIIFYSSPQSRNNVVIIIFLSILIWVLCSLSTSVLASSMGLGVSIWAIILSSLIMVMFSALPVNGIGSLGTTELVWAAALMALGAAKEPSISSGFAVHILILLFSGILGLTAIVSWKFLSGSVDERIIKD